MDQSSRIRTWSDKLKCYLKTLSDEDKQDNLYLCEYQNSFFVSNIRYDKGFGWYVDTGEQALQLYKLTSLHYIHKEDH